MGSRVRHLKLTVRRGINVNSCTSLLRRKSRTVVTVTAAYKNLVYTTSAVGDMGQNPVWEEGATNVFHFDFADGSNEYVTLKLFNRNDDCIGESTLHFSKLNQLLPGGSEMTLPVMVTAQKQYGSLVVDAKILEQQTMGNQGLLTVEIRKGFIKNITSIFGARTTKISAKLIYKHTSYTSGVLENMGNKFVWHEDNSFTFIIDSDLKANDSLRVEVYNLQNKVGECDIPLSSFVELEGNLQQGPSAWVLHTTDLCLPNRGAVGIIFVAGSFKPNPDRQMNSFPQPQHQHLHGILPPGTLRQPPQGASPAYYPPGVSTIPLDQIYYPRGTNTSSNTKTPYLYSGAPIDTFDPSAPEYNREFENQHSRGSPSDTGVPPQYYQTACGAPAGSRVHQYAQQDDAWMIAQNYH